MQPAIRKTVVETEVPNRSEKAKIAVAYKPLDAIQREAVTVRMNSVLLLTKNSDNAVVDDIRYPRGLSADYIR